MTASQLDIENINQKIANNSQRTGIFWSRIFDEGIRHRKWIVHPVELLLQHNVQF